MHDEEEKTEMIGIGNQRVNKWTEMWKCHILNCEPIKITTPSLFGEAGSSGKLEHRALALPDKPGHAKQTGTSVEKRCICVCQKWCHDQQTFPEPKPRMWLCQQTQQLRLWAEGWWVRAHPCIWVPGESTALWYQKHSCKWETLATKWRLTSVGFCFSS